MMLKVANDVASANELPSREARPGRRVNNSAAARKLQGGELREDCVEDALERGLAGRERSWRMRPAASRRPCFRFCPTNPAGVGFSEKPWCGPGAGLGTGAWCGLGPEHKQLGLGTVLA